MELKHEFLFQENYSGGYGENLLIHESFHLYNAKPITIKVPVSTETGKVKHALTIRP